MSAARNQLFTAADAEALAVALYEGRADRLGLPEIEHVRAVVAGVSERAKVVAWLHDTVEDGLITVPELRARGVSEVDLQAIALVTRTPQRGTYMDYIRSLADADGEAGEIAREVKDADLAHNMTRPAPPEMLDMRAPGGRYDRARRIIARARAADPRH